MLVEEMKEWMKEWLVRFFTIQLEIVCDMGIKLIQKKKKKKKRSNLLDSKVLYHSGSSLRILRLNFTSGDMVQNRDSICGRTCSVKAGTLSLG